ncbi:uncharacterized protein PFL1_03003 [Pseudozyma flocculosa PF-1]|uniref:Related to SCP160 - involved in control of mitotic chromsome transmission n=2 Tax=Pseudozyma flocculosa TaxID=84751 RepID=A0A5C3F2R4_9BASI|nr:uncharacterized protein PFL1_03003 [Pseudozyma flocculosa PF-1]EPQ29248.1 hypothetical protein PFL1_03003 [Pseudozyma flocculosa PF-1]SPO37749.1 related to SCP160 - involved in control of mitotic chromsome transmission [Pseudozyma flocculosa]
MVSAADFLKQHQAGLSDAGSANEPAPMADPFPALTQDPFPSLTQDPFPPASSAAVHHGASTAANGKASADRNKDAQPDFSSESAFPSLGSAPAQPKGQWGKKLAPGSPASAATAKSPATVGSASTWNGSAPVIQRSVQQHSFSLVISADTLPKLGPAMSRVQNKYKGVKIEASTTRKAGATTFVLRAADEASIKQAKRELTVLLAKQVSIQVMIPASLRAFVIGTKGKNLKAITDQTGVKVNVPPRDPAAADAPPASNAASRDVDYDDEQIPVTVEGDEINAKQAQSMIQAIVAERTSRTTQRLTHIDHVFYPFISGAKGANSARLESEVGEGDVSVRVPPRAAFLPAREGDEDAAANGGAEPKRERDLSIVVSGDREKVAKVVAAIESQVDEMKSSFRTLAISIPKRQHRFLVGDAANEILASTQCSVELASIDDPSDSVTIRGPQSQLPLALTAAMEKANAVRVEVVDVVAAHRGAPGNDLNHAKNVLRWLNVSGKVPRVQGVQIYLPRPAIVESSGTVQIEIVGADAAEVAQARETIQELVKRVAPSFVAEIDVDPLLHRIIIGKKAQGLKQYEARGVDVIFPPASAALTDGESRSDVLLVLGGSSVVASLPADKKARDAKAKEILDGVRDDIVKAQVAAADLKTETLSVPAKFHRAILGPNGTTLNAIIGEDRAVAVKLGSGKSSGGDKAAAASSSSSSTSEDSIVVRGPSSEVARVVKELRRIAEEAEQDSIVNGHVAELTIDSAHVPHLVGRGGAAVTKLREELGIRIDFGEPSSSATDADGKKKTRKGSTTKVVLTGRKENVEEAKRRLLSQVDKLADETSITVKVPAEMHGSIIGQGGKYVTRLQDTYGVRINFPSAAQSSSTGTSTPEGAEGSAPPSSSAKPARPDQKADEVIIKGGKKGVEGAKAELLELLEYEREHNNVVTLTISKKSIARIMGKGGATINQIRDDSEAQIDVDGEDAQKGTAQVRVRGTKKAVAAAKAAIQSIASEVDAEETYTLTIAPEHHGLLIGPQGSNIRDLIIRAGGPEDAKASAQYVLFPRRGDKATDVVTVRGPAPLAAKIRDELAKAAKVLADRVVYGVVVAPQAQRMLIGRGGSRQSELQAKHNVRLVFPGWKEYASTGTPVNQDELAGGNDLTIVKISGDAESCKAIAQEIRDSFASASKVVEVPRSIHAKLATPQFFRQLRSDYGVSVDTPRNVGSSKANGASAAAASSSSAARIDADPSDDDEFEFSIEELSASDDESVSWTLTGKDEASLDKASAKVASAIKRAGEFSHQGRLVIPQSSVPRVIGRGGSGLSSIQSESGASIEIPRDSGGVCFIRGSEDAVRDAKERIIRVATGAGRRD